MKQLNLKSSEHLYACVKLDETDTITDIIIHNPEDGSHTPIEELTEKLRNAVLLSLLEKVDYEMARFGVKPEIIGFPSDTP